MASAFPRVFRFAAGVRIHAGRTPGSLRLASSARIFPEMPPFRTWAALRYTHHWGFAEVGGTGVGRQGLVDTDLHETPTAGYGLLSVKLGLLCRKWTASIVVEIFSIASITKTCPTTADPFAPG